MWYTWRITLPLNAFMYERQWSFCVPIFEIQRKLFFGSYNVRSVVRPNYWGCSSPRNKALDSHHTWTCVHGWNQLNVNCASRYASKKKTPAFLDEWSLLASRVRTVYGATRPMGLNPEDTKPRTDRCVIVFECTVNSSAHNQSIGEVVPFEAKNKRCNFRTYRSIKNLA